MKIVDIMSPSLVIPALSGHSREEVLAELVACIVQSRPTIDPANAVRVLLDRERVGSTGVGNGLAIPHAKLPRLERAVACFARSAGGVEFGALDGKPTFLFFALLAPEGNASLHLQALARASRLFKDSDFRARLSEGGDIEHLWSVISAKDQQLTLNGT
jgi:nitrogen PTS system EIIA component